MCTGKTEFGWVFAEIMLLLLCPLVVDAASIAPLAPGPPMLVPIVVKGRELNTTLVVVVAMKGRGLSTVPVSNAAKGHGTNTDTRPMHPRAPRHRLTCSTGAPLARPSSSRQARLLGSCSRISRWATISQVCLRSRRTCAPSNNSRAVSCIRTQPSFSRGLPRVSRSPTAASCTLPPGCLALRLGLHEVLSQASPRRRWRGTRPSRRRCSRSTSSSRPAYR